MNFAVAMGSPLAPLAPTVSGTSAVPSADGFTLAVDAALALNAGASGAIVPTPAVSAGPKPIALLVDSAFQTLGAVIPAAIGTGGLGLATAASETTAPPTPPMGNVTTQVPAVPASAGYGIATPLTGVATVPPTGAAVVSVPAPVVAPSNVPAPTSSLDTTSAEDRDVPQTDDVAPPSALPAVGVDPVALQGALAAQAVATLPGLAQMPIGQDLRAAIAQATIAIAGAAVLSADSAVMPATGDRPTTPKPHKGKPSLTSPAAAPAVLLGTVAPTPMPSIAAVDAAGPAAAIKNPALATAEPASGPAHPSEPPAAATGTLVGLWPSGAVVVDPSLNRPPTPPASTDGRAAKRGDGRVTQGDSITAIPVSAPGREQAPVTAALESFTLPDTAGAISLPGAKPAIIGVIAEPVVAARPGHIGREVGVEIARRLSSGGDELVVRLVPAELGRIEVRMTFDERGGLRAVIAADSPAALEMLRRDSADLSRSLSDAGVRSDAQSLSFQTDGNGSGGNRQQRSAWIEADGKSHRDAGHGFFADDAEPLSYRQLRTSGRYDLLA